MKDLNQGQFLQVLDYKIHYQYWTTNHNNVIIIIVHGHGEHSGRYADWASRFHPYNYGICALDLPGHGVSSGRKGHIRHYDDYYAVLERMIEKVEEDYPGKSIVLYGHSMGGNIAAAYTIDRKPAIRSLILSSPWLELAIKPPVFRFWLAKTMYNIFPAFGDRTKLDPKFISRIPEEVQAYKQDPLIHDRITPGLFIPMLFRGLKLVAQGKKMHIPTLIFHGTGDQLTSHKASFKFSEGSDKITYIGYEGGYHELHQDLCRDELFENILDWLASHVVMR